MSSLQEFQAIYDEITEAFRRKEIEGVAKYIAPEWAGLAGDRSLTRTELLQHLGSQMSMLKHIEWKREVTDLRQSGEEFTVRAGGYYQATKAEDGEVVEMFLDNDDTWTHRDGHWLNIRSVAILPT